MIDSFLSQYNLKQFSKEDVEKYLSSPDEMSEILLECYPPIYGGVTYIYYLGNPNENNQRKSLEIFFDASDKVSSYSILKQDDSSNNDNKIEISEGYQPNHGYNDATHSLVLKESQQPTCQKEGYEVIGCASCEWVYKTYHLSIVPCQFEEGICKWCKGKESDYDYQMYNVNLIGQTNFLIDTYNGQYQSGTIFEVKTTILCDADIEVYVNQKKIEKTHYDSDYWGYAFMMPSQDVTIEIKTVSGMLIADESLL